MGKIIGAGRVMMRARLLRHSSENKQGQTGSHLTTETPPKSLGNCSMKRRRRRREELQQQQQHSRDKRMGSKVRGNLSLDAGRGSRSMHPPASSELSFPPREREREKKRLDNYRRKASCQKESESDAVPFRWTSTNRADETGQSISHWKSAQPVF